jgi:hypothetical protein
MGVSYNSVISRDGLVLHLVAGNSRSYPGTGTTWYDISGNNNHGTLVNGPTYSSANGGSISFDGVNDYVNCGYSSLFDLATTKTVAIWINSRSFDGGFQTNDIVNTDNLIVKRTWQFNAYDSNNDNSDASISIYSVGTGGGDRAIATTTEVLKTNQWQHIAFTTPDRLATASRIKIYLNGIEQSVNDFSSGTFGEANTLSINNPLCIGRRAENNLADLHFNGLLDDLRIYSRVLSPLEIKQIYNSTRKRFGV